MIGVALQMLNLIVFIPSLTDDCVVRRAVISFESPQPYPWSPQSRLYSAISCVFSGTLVATTYLLINKLAHTPNTLNSIRQIREGAIIWYEELELLSALAGLVNDIWAQSLSEAAPLTWRRQQPVARGQCRFN